MRGKSGRINKIKEKNLAYINYFWEFPIVGFSFSTKKRFIDEEKLTNV
jgi:hypothetical protein